MASSLEGNKIISAILVAGIIASASGVFSRIIYRPQHLEEPVYKVAVPEQAEATAKPAEEEKPLPVLLAAADPKAGATIAKKCEACHSFEKGGPNKVGPDLWGVVGRPVGKHEGFSYSDAMASKGGNWTYEDLFHFLKAPREYLPGTKMSFAGLPKATDRADVIAYLHTLSDNPEPLPQPEQGQGQPAQGQQPTEGQPAPAQPQPQQGQPAPATPPQGQPAPAQPQQG